MTPRWTCGLAPMSLGYAEKLSFREDLGGQLGDPEIFDDEAALTAKALQLAHWIRDAKGVVFFTGAGISTACGISDFRGPNGVWTLQKQGKPVPKSTTTLAHAVPSLTHMAIAELVRLGKCPYIVSQNVDGLHLRSGVPRANLAELHGNCFCERCPSCKKEHIRDFEIETVGFRQTGRSCTRPGCRGRLRDHILDWEQALPEDELSASERHADAADLSVCLGTSLQVQPANALPERTARRGGRMVVVNLQQTPKDKSAALLVRGRVDQVMRVVMRELQLPVPDYRRHDCVMVAVDVAWPVEWVRAAAEGRQVGDPGPMPTAGLKKDDAGHVGEGREGVEAERPAKRPRASAQRVCVTVEILSLHGRDCPLPMVESARVAFEEPWAGRGLGDASLGATAPLRARWVVPVSDRAADAVARGVCTLHLSPHVRGAPSSVEVEVAVPIAPVLERDGTQAERGGESGAATTKAEGSRCASLTLVAHERVGKAQGETRLRGATLTVRESGSDCTLEALTSNHLTSGLAEGDLFAASRRPGMARPVQQAAVLRFLTQHVTFA